MTTRTAPAVVLSLCVALAGAGLAACGRATPPGASGASPGTPTFHTSEGDPTVAHPKPSSGQHIRVVGTVTAGVEAGCLTLSSGGTEYLLLGGRSELHSGDRVEVEGVLQPDLLTTCQQGTPLVVQRVVHR
ncbi:hypothetical protein [Oryzihumus sp.]